jgi:hypothetical protein
VSGQAGELHGVPTSLGGVSLFVADRDVTPGGRASHNGESVTAGAVPPLWFARAFAYVLTVATFALVTFWWGGEWEKANDELADRYELAGWLLLGALLPAWLSYIWTRQGHFDHGTIAFVLSAGITAASVLVAFT